MQRCSAVLGRQRRQRGFPRGCVRTQVPHTAPPHSRFAVVSPTRALHQDIVAILMSIGGRMGGVVAIGLVKEIVAMGLVGAIKLLHCRHEVVAVGVVG
ncbi:hypothetical protein [Moorena producens]|uniref:hypothetical protein n=1 Tax=Moorena producens TaxID=1155739 RepID=UPI003C73A57B